MSKDGACGGRERLLESAVAACFSRGASSRVRGLAIPSVAGGGRESLTMSVRESLNKNPIVAIAGAGVLVVICIVVLISTLSGGGADTGPQVLKWYYTTDLGATWFADEAYKPVPFSKDGKDAVRARVYKCGEKGAEFVAYIEKFTDAGRKKLDAVGNDPIRRQMVLSEMYADRLVAKPKSSAWIGGAMPAAQQVQKVTCPDGSTNGLIEALPK